MSDDNQKTSKNYRREFFKNIGLIGTGAVFGSVGLHLGMKFEKEKEGKEVYLLTSDNKAVKFDGKNLKELQLNTDALLARGREGIPNRRWVMVIDLSRCKNARKCISSCQEAHQLKPHQYHLNTLVMQDSPQGAPYYMPKQCQHCDNPPCVSVCPVDATYKRNDGIVLIDNQRCIGCRFCMSACPYSARIFNWFDPKDAEKYADAEYDVELNVPQAKGTVSKCVFSADRLRVGELPYCVSACPNGVYWFGDENEDAVTNGTTKETKRLSELLRDNDAKRLMEELGQKPRIYYLPAKDRAFPFPEDNTTGADNMEHV